MKEGKWNERTERERAVRKAHDGGKMRARRWKDHAKHPCLVQVSQNAVECGKLT